MKTRISAVILGLVFILLISSQKSFSQPFTFSYQVVLEDDNGLLMTNKKVPLFVSLLQGKSGQVLWQESFNVRTNIGGAAQLNIGNRNLIPNGISSLLDFNWSGNDQWIRINLNTANGKLVGLLPITTLPSALITYKTGSTEITGSIIAVGGDDYYHKKEGWLICDGRELDIEGIDSLSKIPYRRLYDVIGTAYGSSGPMTFRLPDFRGRFPRGVDSFSTADPDAQKRYALYPGGAKGANVGSYQKDDIKAHNAKVNDVTIKYIVDNSTYWPEVYQYSQGDVIKDDGNFSIGAVMKDSQSTQSPSGATRPKNAAVYYLIKL